MREIRDREGGWEKDSERQREGERKRDKYTGRDQGRETDVEGVRKMESREIHK